MNFLEKTCKKGLKQKSEHYHQVFSILNSLNTKFQPKMTSLNFWTKLTQKGYFQSKKENNENHHQILHIRISLILYLNFNNFYFWNKFPKKGYFRSKTEKDITIELFIFELV